LDDLAIGRFGDWTIWRFGELTIWRFGELTIWRFGDLTIWDSLKKSVGERGVFFRRVNPSVNRLTVFAVGDKIL